MMLTSVFSMLSVFIICITRTESVSLRLRQQRNNYLKTLLRGLHKAKDNKHFSSVNFYC